MASTVALTFTFLGDGAVFIAGRGAFLRCQWAEAMFSPGVLAV